MTHHAFDALKQAAFALCADADLPVRVANAAALLAHVEPDRDLPESARFRFQELVDDIAYGADTVSDALARMSRGDQERLATRVISLFADVALASHG